MIFDYFASQIEFMIKKVTNIKDIKTTANLAHKVWNHHYVPIIGQEQVDYMLEKIQSEKAITNQIDTDYEYYLLYDDDKAIGYLGLRPNLPEEKLMISKIYVDHTIRGKGYGYQLLEFTKQLCTDRSIATIWLTVNRHNTNTINWYKKRGFKITEEKQFDIGKGYIMDDYVLEVATEKLLT